MMKEDRPAGQVECDALETSFNVLKTRLDAVELAPEIRAELDAILQKIKDDGENERRRYEDELARTKQELRKELDARRYIEQALSSFHRWVYNFIENIPIGISIVDTKGRPTQRNRYLQGIYGYDSKEELLKGLVVEHYYDKNDLKRFLDLLSNGPVRDFETRLKRKDGTPFWANISAVSQVTETGETQFATVIQDITKRKQAEKALKESEEKYRNLFETMAQGVVYRDGEGKVIEVNTAAEKILRTTVGEMMGTTLAERNVIAFHEDGSDFPNELHPSLVALKTGAEINNVIMRRLFPDGNSCWLRVNARSQVHPDENRPYQVYTTIEDITQIKEMEEELKLRAELLDAANDAIFLRESDGKFIYTNEAVCRDYGYTRSELMGMSMIELMAPERRPFHESRKNEIFAKGALRFETTYECKDKTQIPVEVQAQVIKLGERNLILSVVRNITERKRVDDEQRNISVKLLEMQEKERRSIGLELHDQTGQCLTALKLLIGRAAIIPPEQARPVLADALNLTDDILQQLRGLSLSLRPPMLDDMGLLAALIWHCERYQAQTQLIINLSHSGLKRKFPKEVAMAAFRIAQAALTNVVRHAQAKEAYVRIWVRQDALHIRVKDNGAGFDPSTIVPGKSTGLDGMRERASMLGGELTIKSAPGAGTTVTAVIPITGWGERKN